MDAHEINAKILEYRYEILREQGFLNQWMAAKRNMWVETGHTGFPPAIDDVTKGHNKRIAECWREIYKLQEQLDSIDE